MIEMPDRKIKRSLTHPDPPPKRTVGGPIVSHHQEQEARIEFWKSLTVLVKRLTEAVDIIIEEQRK